MEAHSRAVVIKRRVCLDAQCLWFGPLKTQGVEAMIMSLDVAREAKDLLDEICYGLSQVLTGVYSRKLVVLVVINQRVCEG